MPVQGESRGLAGSLAGWLMRRWNGVGRQQSGLEMLDRIVLGPRQSLALIEAQGRRILVATSQEGAPAFYPLDQTQRRGERKSTQGEARISW